MLGNLLRSSAAGLLLTANLVAAQSFGNVELIDPVSRFSDLKLSLPANQGYPPLQHNFESPPDCGETSYKGRGRLQGLKALITGGDSGIGRAVVIAYLREGVNVTINYLPEEEQDAQDLADFVGKEGYSFNRIPGDLRNESFCTELVNEAAYRMDGLDILVGNAGYSGSSGPSITNDTTEVLERTFITNVYSNFWLAKAAIPLLPRGGSIIFTASGIVAHPSPTSAVYGSSKAALIYIARSLAQQLAPAGIRVNAIAPNVVYTPLLVEAGFTTEILAEVAKGAPVSRVEQPAELAPLYVDLATPDKTYVSGGIFGAMGGAVSP